MTNEQILKKAVEKAVKNGLDCELGGTGKVVKVFHGKNITAKMLTMFEFIFSHDFAKAIWGKETIYKLQCSKCKADYNIWDEKDSELISASYCCYDGKKLKRVVDYVSETWQGELRRMVLEPEPLKYIEKFL